MSRPILRAATLPGTAFYRFAAPVIIICQRRRVMAQRMCQLLGELAGGAVDQRVGELLEESVLWVSWTYKPAAQQQKQLASLWDDSIHKLGQESRLGGGGSCCVSKPVDCSQATLALVPALGL